MTRSGGSKQRFQHWVKVRQIEIDSCILRLDDDKVTAHTIFKDPVTLNQSTARYEE